MGYEYALVHLKYTIPFGIVLSLIYRPFFTPLDLYKILFLISIAVLSTIPWDSYLIRHKIWTYPPQVTMGLNIYSIPVEEIFFFIIQTYNTTLLYLLLNKPLFHASYLRRCLDSPSLFHRLAQVAMSLLVVVATVLIKSEGESTYLGLILVWSVPFMLILWSLSSQFIVGLPYTSTLVPILLPTLYLWVVDTIALRRGTWAIESGTKLGIQLWEGLEIEEAIFFLVTNILVVFGLVAFDHSLTILLSFPKLFPDVPQFPSPYLLIKALLMDRSQYDRERIFGIHRAVEKLKKKSRSFYLASATFSGRLRIDLVLLYAFCRVADDLVDDAGSKDEASHWINMFTQYLKLSYPVEKDQDIGKTEDLQKYIQENFPSSTHSTLQLLPTHLLSSKPFYDLLEGFKIDLEFLGLDSAKVEREYPIYEECHLEGYATHVASTVAELFLELVFHHSDTQISLPQRQRLLRAGRRMGIALQYVNIARDIETDAKIGRIYLPSLWLKEEDISHNQFIKKPFGLEIEKLRAKLIDKAFDLYHEARHDMSLLPPEVRAPMRVAVESYMEIGRVSRERGCCAKRGRAIVPKWRRLIVAWRALTEN